MNDILQRIGLPMMLQIAIECWNELFLLILILTMLIGVKQDRSNEVLRKTEIPLTKELIIFYGAAFMYNLCDIMDNAFGTANTRSAYYLIRIGIFMYYLLGGFQTVFLLGVVRKFAAQKVGKRLENAVTVFQFLQIPNGVLLLLTPFVGALYHFGSKNEYIRSWGYYVWQGITILSFVFIGVVIIVSWKKLDAFIKNIFVIAAVFPTIGLLCGSFSNVISPNNMMVSLSALLMFMVYETNRTEVTVRRARQLENAKTKLAESRLLLEQSKSETLMAQIQPHFINNSLMAIRSQCRDYPEVYESITNFSRYLRSNFEALGDARRILFEQEMENVEAYLSLEQRNYADRLKIEYDIDCDDFLVPPLSVQPLVENAVRHGIGTREHGGTVTISAHKVGDNAVIEIRDDGCGSSNITDKQQTRKGIGIENVRRRLRSMSGGELEIMFNDNGTTARITVPYINETSS